MDNFSREISEFLSRQLNLYRESRLTDSDLQRAFKLSEAQLRVYLKENNKYPDMKAEMQMFRDWQAVFVELTAVLGRSTPRVKKVIDAYAANIHEYERVLSVGHRTDQQIELMPAVVREGLKRISSYCAHHLFKAQNV